MLDFLKKKPNGAEGKPMKILSTLAARVKAALSPKKREPVNYAELYAQARAAERALDDFRIFSAPFERRRPGRGFRS
jgi:hypothetical protein